MKELLNFSTPNRLTIDSQMAVTDPFAGVGIDPSLSQSFETMQKLMLDQMRFPQVLIDPAQQSTQAQQAQISWANTQNVGEQQPKPNINIHARARGMLIDRLGGIDGPMKLKDGDFLMCHCFWGTVYVFFVFNKRDGVTKESTDIFPSDKLVAQLRMVMIA